MAPSTSFEFVGLFDVMRADTLEDVAEQVQLLIGVANRGARA